MNCTYYVGTKSLWVMKLSKKQELLQKEILDCYNTEIVAINGLFKSMGKLDRKIAKSLSILSNSCIKKERLIHEYGELAKQYSNQEEVENDILADFTEIEEEYRSNIDCFNKYVDTVRKDMFSITNILKNSNATISAFKKTKLSLRERIDLWAKNARYTYNEIYSV